MAEVIHNRGLAQQLTGGMRKAGQEASAAPARMEQIQGTRLAAVDKAARQHRQLASNLAALVQAGGEIAGRIDSVAAAFDGLDAEQARRMHKDSGR